MAEMTTLYEIQAMQDEINAFLLEAHCPIGMMLASAQIDVLQQLRERLARRQLEVFADKINCLRRQLSAEAAILTRELVNYRILTAATRSKMTALDWEITNLLSEAHLFAAQHGWQIADVRGEEGKTRFEITDLQFRRAA